MTRYLGVLVQSIEDVNELEDKVAESLDHDSESEDSWDALYALTAALRRSLS